MSAESHLASLGITIQQANDFILSHIDEPLNIFNTAKQFNVTTSMLSEITGFSINDIREYFASFGLDTTELNTERLLLSSDLLPLANFLAFNDDSGGLSTATLREGVIAATNSDDYLTFFDPSSFQGSEDGVFTPEELGTAHLGNVPATTETLESLFYGTFISTSRDIDTQELQQIDVFLEANPDELENDTVSLKYIELAISVFNDPAPAPFFSEPQIALFAIEIGIRMVEFVGMDRETVLLDSALLF